MRPAPLPLSHLPLKGRAVARSDPSGYIKKGGVPVIGKSLTFSMSGDDGVITRNDGGSFITDGQVVDGGVVVQGGANDGKFGIIKTVLAGSITIDGTKFYGPFTAQTTTSSKIYPIFQVADGPSTLGIHVGDRVLDLDNTDDVERGPWLLTSSGWVRPPEADDETKLDVGSLVFVDTDPSGQHGYALTTGRLGFSQTWEAFGVFDPAVGGDLSGTASAAQVVKLLGRSLDTATPNDGDVLTWNAGSSKWTPSAGLPTVAKGDADSTFQMVVNTRYLMAKTSGSQKGYMPNGSAAVGNRIEMLGMGLGITYFIAETLSGCTILAPDGVVAAGGGNLTTASGRCSLAFICVDATPGAIVWALQWHTGAVTIS